MKLEGKTLTPGQELFYSTTSASGNTKWHGGEVADTNEHVKAVKVRHAFGDRLKSTWFPLAQLAWKIPEPKEHTS